MTRGTIYVRMGEMLGMPIRSEADAWCIVKSGIPTENYVQLVTRLRLAPNAVVSETTLRRRLSQAPAQKGTSARHHVARLNPAETERVMRITRVVADATELFGTEKAALQWLKNPGDFLGDETQVTPMKLAETDSGARLVELLIQRSANGFF